MTSLGLDNIVGNNTEMEIAKIASMTMKKESIQLLVYYSWMLKKDRYLADARLNNNIIIASKQRFEVLLTL